MAHQYIDLFYRCCVFAYFLWRKKKKNEFQMTGFMFHMIVCVISTKLVLRWDVAYIEAAVERSSTSWHALKKKNEMWVKNTSNGAIVLFVSQDFCTFFRIQFSNEQIDLKNRKTCRKNFNEIFSLLSQSHWCIEPYCKIIFEIIWHTSVSNTLHLFVLTASTTTKTNQRKI